MTVLRASSFAVLVAAAAGCDRGDGVNSYTVKRAAEPTAKDAAAGTFRLLGAMVPADNPVWFFKLSGPADAVAKVEPGFDQLLAGVRFAGGADVPGFTLPDGWKTGGPRDGFVKVAQTIRPPDSPLEVTVVASGGGIDPNLDRWVGMLGHKGGPDDRARFTKSVEAAGGKLLRVDIRGPKNPSAAPMMGKGR